MRMARRGLVERNNPRHRRSRHCRVVLTDEAGTGSPAPPRCMLSGYAGRSSLDLDPEHEDALADILAVVHESLLREGTLPRPDSSARPAKPGSCLLSTKHLRTCHEAARLNPEEHHHRGQFGRITYPLHRVRRQTVEEHSAAGLVRHQFGESSVRMGPGTTVLTRKPRSPNSVAQVRPEGPDSAFAGVGTERRGTLAAAVGAGQNDRGTGIE